jgi:hypothetical protein
MVEDNFALDDAQKNAASSTPSKAKRVLGKILILVGILVLLGFTVIAIIFLSKNPSTTIVVRDIFIIFLAFESLIIGLALIILVIQLATLINLIQNELRPIILNTQDTVNNLKGTTQFLSEQLVTPVIKLNSYLAGFKKVFDLLRLGKKK